MVDAAEPGIFFRWSGLALRYAFDFRAIIPRIISHIGSDGRKHETSLAMGLVDAVIVVKRFNKQRSKVTDSF